MPHCVRRIAGALLLSFFGLAQAAPQLLVPVARTQAGGGATTLAKAGTGTAVHFNAEVMSLAPGSEVELTLPSGSRHTYVFERLVPHGGGMATWIARSPLTGSSERAVITRSNAGAWGWMQTRHGEFRIRPDGAHDLLTQVAAKNLSPAAGGSDAVRVGDDPPGLEPLKGVPTYVAAPADTSGFGPRAAPAPLVRIDVMFLYTRDLADKLGPALMPMLNNLVASLNAAYADSEIAITARMVNATMIELDNAAGSGTVLGAMRGSPADTALRTLFEPLTWGAGSLRNVVGADYVAVLRDGPTDTGGIGNLNFNPVVGTVNSTTGYSVNNYCASGCEGIVAHEIGHNMGNHHDRATIAKDDTAAPAGEVDETGVFPYSYGYYSCSAGLDCNPFASAGALTCTSGYAGCAGNDANDFGSIMSYFSPKVMKFSSPLVTCVPTGGNSGAGRPCGDAGSDNARGMNEIRTNLAAYRSETIPDLPGSLQFTTSSYSGTESDGTIVFAVSRAGGTAGAVSVNYSVANGTAIAGSDYTAASGTLHWGAGDGADKTFAVTLANDSLAEGVESLVATLATPAGTTGVYLGYPVSVTGFVVEPWPTGGVAPAGFTTPATSSVPWDIAIDSTADGTGASWKSGAMNFSVENCNDDVYGSIPCPSSTQYAGSFAAGILAFAYRVSSFPGYGFLEFLVDGAVVFTASGDETDADTGWQSFQTTIAAGAHTLEWRYRTRFGFPCAAASSAGGAPLYPGCLDRAWIDQVSLPLAAAASTTALTSSVNPSASGESVTFTATVTGSSGTPAGTVNFRDGAGTIGSCGAVTLNGSGVASCATTTLATGSSSITAVYSGSATYAGSTSNTVTQVVAGTQLLTPSPATLAFGGQSMNTTSPTLTATLTASSAVTVTSVTPPANYAIVGNTCATLAAAGTCQLTVVFTPTAEGNRDGVLLVNYAGGGPTPIFVTGVGERSLVTHYYRSILRRAPDSGGKAYWEGEAARVQALGANVNEVWFAMAIQFFFSPEYAAFNRDTNGFLTDLYTTFFNRAPDSGGLEYWASEMAGGMPREVVLAGFMFSPEFDSFTQAIFGNATVRAEMDVVMDFYRGLLSRLPDDGGFNYWVGRFRSAQCSGAAAVYSEVEAISSGFADSPEYAARGRNNGQFVGDLYNSFLRRGGDLEGVNFWVSQLGTGARTRNNERQAFISQPEFSARVQAIINQGCL